MSSGEDGPSQMALEDLAMFRAIPTCTVFYPSDAVSTERAVELSANIKVGWPPCGRVCPVSCLYNDDGTMFLCLTHRSFCYFQGICFIRTSRPDTAVIYSPDEKFEVGVAKVMINTMIIHTACALSGHCQQKQYKY